MEQTLLASPIWDFLLSEFFARQPMQLRLRPSPSHKQYRGGSFIHFKSHLERVEPLLRALQKVCIISAVIQCLTALPGPVWLPLPLEYSAPPFAVPHTPQEGSCLMLLHLLFLLSATLFPQIPPGKLLHFLEASALMLPPQRDPSLTM